MRVLIACSSGGHLAQAWALRSWWQQHERVWVTFPTLDAQQRLAEETVLYAYHPTNRNLPNLLRNTRLARRVVHQVRPDLVFSTGAAVAVPFLSTAHRRGIRTAYLEPVDRFQKPSLTARLVYPFADEFMIQWPELEPWFPGCRNIGLVL